METYDIDPQMRVFDYWQERLRRHHHDKYKDRYLVKMPEDLRTYQHVIWDTQPNVIVELGAYDGGSAIWFYDQLLALTNSATKRRRPKPLVITVDTNDVAPDPSFSFILGNHTDKDVIRAVREQITPRDRVMVVEDSAHTHSITSAALRNYHDLVTIGCYFVVEDAIVDTKLALPEWKGAGGVRAAIEEFVAAHPEFTREHLAPYGLTMHFGGWLKKHG